jgi:hypothetical protein
MAKWIADAHASEEDMDAEVDSDTETIEPTPHVHRQHVFPTGK